MFQGMPAYPQLATQTTGIPVERNVDVFSTSLSLRVGYSTQSLDDGNAAASELRQAIDKLWTSAARSPKNGLICLRKRG